MRKGGRVARRDHRQVAVAEHLQEREIRLCHLAIRHDLLQRDGEGELNRHPERVLERRVSVQFEDAEIDVVSTQRSHQRRERDPDPLVPPRVRLVFFRRGSRQRGASVRHHQF